MNSPHKGHAVTRSFDVFFDLRLNKRLRRLSRRRCFETTSRSTWPHKWHVTLAAITVTSNLMSYLYVKPQQLTLRPGSYRWNLSWIVNCVQVIAVVLDSQTDVPDKVSKFLRQNCLYPEGTWTPNIRCGWSMSERQLLTSASKGINLWGYPNPKENSSYIYSLYIADYRILISVHHRCDDSQQVENRRSNLWNAQ